MDIVRNIREWSVAHHPRWLVVLRVALGLALCIKGIAFMNNATLVEELLGSSSMAGNTHAWQIIISWANMLGGVMITIGLLTRLMCLIQMPILVGAVIFINAQKSGFAPQSELGLACLTLVLLIFFLIEGSGPLSLDAYFASNKERGSKGVNMP